MSFTTIIVILVTSVLTALITALIMLTAFRKYSHNIIEREFQGQKDDFSSELESRFRMFLNKIENEINKEMSQCIGEIVNFDKYKYDYMWGHKPIPKYVQVLREKVAETIRDHFRKEITSIQSRYNNLNTKEYEVLNKMKEEFEDRINSEEFLDDIIVRIKRKQLTK